MSTPLPGWYNDPADASRHRFWDGDVWTEKTRPGGGATVLGASAEAGSSAKAGGSKGRTVAIVAAVAVGVAAIIGVGVAVLAGDDKSPGSSNSDFEQEMSSTGAWETYSSRSGSLEYVVDPAWTDLYTPEDERTIVEEGGGIEGAEFELGGLWMHSGTLYTGGTMILVMAVDDGIGSLSLTLETRTVALELGAMFDDYEESVSEGFTTAAGDEAYRIDFQGATAGMPMTGSVITISHGSTVVMAYAMSDDSYNTWLGDFLAMSDSIVVVRPPTSL